MPGSTLRVAAASVGGAGAFVDVAGAFLAGGGSGGTGYAHGGGFGNGCSNNSGYGANGGYSGGYGNGNRYGNSGGYGHAMAYGNAAGYTQHNTTTDSVVGGVGFGGMGGVTGGTYMQTATQNIPVLQDSSAANQATNRDGYNFPDIPYGTNGDEEMFTLMPEFFPPDLLAGLSEPNEIMMSQIIGEDQDLQMNSLGGQMPTEAVYTSQLLLPQPIPKAITPPSSLPTVSTSIEELATAPQVSAETPAEKPKCGGPKATKQANNENKNCGPRTSKPATSKEVVPLTAKDTPISPPEWLTTAHMYLKEGADNAGWLKCVAAWFRFEEQVLLESTSHRLAAKHRPDALSRWLSSRKYPPPAVEDQAAFGGQWIGWWNSLQPEWHQVEAQDHFPLPLSKAEDGDDVMLLRKGGPSGLVTVMISLKWWTTDARWKEAITDVKDCLKQVVKGTKKQAPRSRGGVVRGQGKCDKKSQHCTAFL
ncbi:unnamed protein product [Cyclocybe aegerita]|uniref:Uncharacterized protein n=1 Tax=Cyclocybe aegerita TaxID=1973307 RepID=A0A8S0WCK6_CYCAE|nr:unnamed protein product [Cyclocybe aegerita]